MQIRLEDELLMTSMHITINGASKIIGNIVIDTGAAHSMLSSDAVDDMNIRYVNGDKLVTICSVLGKWIYG